MNAVGQRIRDGIPRVECYRYNFVTTRLSRCEVRISCEKGRRGPSKTSRTRRSSSGETIDQRPAMVNRHDPQNTQKPVPFVPNPNQSSHSVPDTRRSPDNPDVSSILFNYFAGTLTSGMRGTSLPAHARVLRSAHVSAQIDNYTVMESRLRASGLLTRSRGASELLEARTKISGRTVYMEMKILQRRYPELLYIILYYYSSTNPIGPHEKHLNRLDFLGVHSCFMLSESTLSHPPDLFPVVWRFYL